MFPGSLWLGRAVELLGSNRLESYFRISRRNVMRKLGLALGLLAGVAFVSAVMAGDGYSDK